MERSEAKKHRAPTAKSGSVQAAKPAASAGRPSTAGKAVAAAKPTASGGGSARSTPKPRAAETRELNLSSTAGATATATDSTESSDEASQWSNRRASAQATRAANARQASGRRRFVDPTTCERDYSTAEMEFMQAMQQYKLSSGRMFPTWSEVLEVLKALGYAKPESSGEAAADPKAAQSA